MSNPRLAIVTTHPIQYNAPFFKSLSQTGKIDIHVFYTWGKKSVEKFDPGFGKVIQWDVPLLEGYPYTFVKNIALTPGSHHFWGIVCPALIKEIKAFQPDAILVYGWNFYSHLKLMRYFKGRVPVWFRGDSHLLDEVPGWKTYLRRKVLTFIYKYVDKAFYVGTNNKDYYLAHGLTGNQLVWMPHAVDNAFFFNNNDVLESQALQWRRSLGIKEEDFVILYAGKFEPVKNPALLINAIIQINEGRDLSLGPINYLLMVGNGILEPKLKALAQAKPYIHFSPFQNQSIMPVVYRLGNVFCLPSKSETWGLAVNEAMACGRPVIVSDRVGSAKDLVIDGETGFSFTSGAVNELIEKIKLLTNISDNIRSNCLLKVAEYTCSKQVSVLINEFT